MTEQSNRVPTRSAAVAASLLLILTLSACTASRQPRGIPDGSGFLGNYSELRPGKGDEAVPNDVYSMIGRFRPPA